MHSHCSMGLGPTPARGAIVFHWVVLITINRVGHCEHQDLGSDSTDRIVPSSSSLARADRCLEVV